MKYNPVEVANLRPDYLGFIFYDKSPRNFEGDMPSLPAGILKVGVFVDATKEVISEKIKQYDLDVVQLHGDESVEFCNELRLSIGKPIELWKVFRLKDEFNFSLLKPFEMQVDKFLFDTKGKEKGGTGHKFNWKLLQSYHSKTPLILSGGIGLEDTKALLTLMKTNIPLHAIDVNSRFEIKPGLKNINDLKQLIHEL